MNKVAKMALSLCLGHVGSWQMYLFIVFLCTWTCTHWMTSPVWASLQLDIDSQKQPSDDKDRGTNNDETFGMDKTSHESPKRNKEIEGSTKSTRSNLPRDDHTTDETQTTDHMQALTESHDSKQPVKSDQKDTQSTNVKSQTTSVDRQGETKENIVQDVNEMGGGADHEIKDKDTTTENKESMTDQPASQDNGTLKTAEDSDDLDGIPETNRQTEMTNEQQLEAPGQKNDLKSETPELDLQNKEKAELHVENVGEYAKETNMKDRSETENMDVRLKEDDLNSAEPTLAPESLNLAKDSSEPARTEEEVLENLSVLPTQEDIPSKEVTFQNDPGSKPVEGASVRGDKASQESSTVDVQDTLKDGSEDTTKEDAKGKDKEQVIPGDVDVAGMKPKEDEKEKVTKEQEGKKPDATQKDDEDIPSFDEWKQKMLEQHQQERENGQVGQGSAAQPIRPFSLTENSKNHASSDCGAKILNVNKESQNAPAILQSNRDVYTLNPCSANIWFIVELCEPIQVKHLEIANYELFSSVPKSFRVSISDRFPSREWRQFGTFHARDERSLQSFPVHEEQMFAKYLKIEMLTFFGNEHYCPLSTLRIFGTSMVEEIDDENIPHEPIHEEPEVLPAHPTPVPEDGDKSLLQSAKGLVRNIMNVITGNGKDEAMPCDKKNKSCTQEEEMLPCMPEDKPKSVKLENSSLLAPEKPQMSECKSKNASGFSVDPLRFHTECQGSTWCFSPNYGEHFQDCCLRVVSEFLSPTQKLLCCKDMLQVSLYFSEKSTKTFKWPRPLRLSRDRKRDREKWKKVQETETEAKKKNASTKSETGDVMRKDHTLQEDTSATAVTSSDQSSMSVSSKPATDKQSKMQVKPTVTISTPQEKSSPPGQQLPSPTQSLKSTCEMKQEPVGIPPISIHPTSHQVVVEVSSKVNSEPSPKETQGNKKETSPERMKMDAETQSIEIPPIVIEDVPEKIVEGGTLRDGESGKTLAKDTAAKEVKTPVSKDETGAASADPEKPYPAATLDKSRKADATEKDAAETQDSEEAKKGVQDDSKDVKESSREEAAAKSPEAAKVEMPGKGTKPVSDTGGNGISSAVQKESVFMRLNNRIKVLELNMSLSSRYLEELSQRYRKRMDEMQKAFNKTIKTLTENAQKAEEKDQRQQEYITRLEGQMSEVMIGLEATSQRLDRLHKEVIERHFFLMFVEILLISVLFLICIRRLRRGRRASSHSPTVVARNRDVNIRRNSVPATPPKREQNGTALRNGQRTISGGSCDDLLIIGPSTPFLESLKQANEPARQKPKNKPKHKLAIKSMSNSTIPHNHQSTSSSGAPHRQTKMTAAGVLFRGPASNGRRTLPASTTDPLQRTVSVEELPGRVQDIKGGAPPIRQPHPKPSGKHLGKKQGVIMNGRR